MLDFLYWTFHIVWGLCAVFGILSGLFIWRMFNK